MEVLNWRGNSVFLGLKPVRLLRLVLLASSTICQGSAVKNGELESEFAFWDEESEVS